jgi:exonuclease SbcD
VLACANPLWLTHPLSSIQYMNLRPKGGLFLHCADIHLDSPIHGLVKHEGAPEVTDELGNATRRSFQALVDLAIERDVKAVVIAGDLYDGERDDWSTAVFLQKELRRLQQAHIPVIIAWGNHDAANKITHRLHPPENVHVLSSQQPETVELKDAGLAFHGQSYPRRDVMDTLVPNYPEPVEEMLNVGVLHTALKGSAGHEPYAPCSQWDLEQKRYQYWALGHVHQRQAIEPTREGDPWIVYPGNLQGRHPRESGSKGATLVTYEDTKVVSCEHVPLCVLEWEVIQVDFSPDLLPGTNQEGPLENEGLSFGIEDILSSCSTEIEQALAEASNRGAEFLAARVVISCGEPAYSHLVSGRERVATQLQADAGNRVWIERIDINKASQGQRPLPKGNLAARIEETVRLALANKEVAEKLMSDLEPLRLLLGNRGITGGRRTSELLDGAGLNEDFLENPSDILEEAGALLMERLGLSPSSNEATALIHVLGDQDVD